MSSVAYPGSSENPPGRLKCDYCGQPGVSLTGETNGVIVCIDHARRVTPRYTPDLRAAIKALPITCIDGVNYVSRRDLLDVLEDGERHV